MKKEYDLGKMKSRTNPYIPQTGEESVHLDNLSSGPRDELLQQQMIRRLRELCQRDRCVVGALMFGSFATGEGDQYSDIEFALFFDDESLLRLDQRAWISQIEPVELYFADDYGHHTAIFANLVRGEFHFEPASKIPIIETWQGYAWFPSMEATLIVDRTGAVERHLRPFIAPPPDRNTPDEAASVIDNFINLTLLGTNVLARGEAARAWALLGSLHANLLKLIRLAEGATQHWPTPSRALEADISARAYERYRSCTADLDPSRLWPAYRNTWRFGCELVTQVGRRNQIAPPISVMGSLSERIEAGCK